ncbi:unnamed protein product, partial [Ectocarpus fasciculatus]
MTSLVARRIAELEGSSSAHSTTSPPHPSQPLSPDTKISAPYHRGRLEVKPTSISSDETEGGLVENAPLPYQCNPATEDDRTAGGEGHREDDNEQIPWQSFVIESKPLATTSLVHQHHQAEPEGTDIHAGGYYARPKKPPQRVVHRDAGSNVTAAVFTASVRQQEKNASLATKIAQLEAALVTSQGRVAQLVSSSATAAENASRRRREKEAAIDKERASHRRVSQLEDTLAQAEKRASWLHGELKVVWACGIQRVNELEYELEVTRRQQAHASTGHEPEETASPTENGSAAPFGGSFRGASLRHGAVESGESEDNLDKLMDDTKQALSDLRTKFYRAMGERNDLKVRCDFLEEQLLNNSTIADTDATSFSTGGDTRRNNEDEKSTEIVWHNGADDGQRSPHHGGRQAVKDTSARSGSNSRTRSRSASQSTDSSVGTTTGSSATVAPEDAPVTTASA